MLLVFTWKDSTAAYRRCSVTAADIGPILTGSATVRPMTSICVSTSNQSLNAIVAETESRLASMVVVSHDRSCVCCRCRPFDGDDVSRLDHAGCGCAYGDATATAIVIDALGAIGNGNGNVNGSELAVGNDRDGCWTSWPSLLMMMTSMLMT